MPWLDAAWCDAGWHEPGAVPFDVADRGLLLADGVFDTALLLGGRLVWGDRHRARLLAHARAIGLEVDPQRLGRAYEAVAARFAEGAVRVTLTRGPGPRGLAPPRGIHPTIVATAAPLNRSLLFAPLALGVTEIRRNDQSPTARIKSLAYLDGVLAAGEAIGAGFDDALFLNTHAKVACTTTGNVFALYGTQLATPRLSDGAMDGITRGFLLETCDSLGLEPVERTLSLSDLGSADAVFASNSLRLVAPARRIGSRKIGTTLEAAALIAHVAEAVKAQTGIDPAALARR